jgi:hypothetical protein
VHANVGTDSLNQLLGCVIVVPDEAITHDRRIGCDHDRHEQPAG